MPRVVAKERVGLRRNVPRWAVRGKLPRIEASPEELRLVEIQLGGAAMGAVGARLGGKRLRRVLGNIELAAPVFLLGKFVGP